MALTMQAFLAGLLALGLCACARQQDDRSAFNRAAGVEGPGVVLNFEKQQALWVDVRSSPEGRVLGWSQKGSTPAYVVYPQRGFNPVFSAGTPVRVAWIDQNRVVRIDETKDSGDKSISPPQEVTAALVAPLDSEWRISAGDKILLVDSKDGRP